MTFDWDKWAREAQGIKEPVNPQVNPPKEPKDNRPRQYPKDKDEWMRYHYPELFPDK